MSMEAKGLPGLSVRRPTLVVVLNLLIIIAGFSAILGVEVRELPDVDRPIVTVRAFFDGASPETMDAEVTSVIESAVARVNGVQYINAASEENNARVRAEFAPNVDLNVAANDIREAVARVQRRMPDGVEDIVVIKADADSQPIIRLVVASDSLPPTELTRIAEDEVATALSGVPGVASVDLYGARKRVLRVVIDPMKLARYQLSIDDVATLMRGSSLDIPAGSFKSEDHMLLVRADATVWRPGDIENLAIRGNIKLGDVAKAFYGPADELSRPMWNGQHVIGLGVVRQAKSNTIQISDGVDKALVKLNKRLRDVQVVKISDDARFIRASVREVISTLFITVAVVIAVIYLFMGSIRPTLLPAISIPIALVGTVAAIYLLGFSINILTLLALVLATGMIVDDSIVVVENIQRHRNMGHPPLAASVIGTRQVFFAVIATTATLISVFLPIAFLPSMAGRLFAEFGFVLAIAVAISSFVALSMCPMLASRMPDPGGASAMPRFLSAFGEWLAGLYRHILEFVLTARLLVLGALMLVAATAVGTYFSIKEELLPREDRGAIIVSMQGPDGVGLDYMDRQAAKAEALLQPLLDSGEAEHIYTVVGRWDLNRVFIMAPLSDWGTRRSQGEIAAKLRRPLSQIPGSTARIWQRNSLNLRRSGGKLEFALTGNTYPEIAAAADDFLTVLQREMPGLEDPNAEYQQTQPQLTVQVNRRKAEDLGVPVDGVTTTLRAMVERLEVTELNVNDRSVPVLLESATGAIDDPSDLHNLYVRSSTGKLVPLSAFVTLEEAGIAAELDRTGQKRAIEIDTDLAPELTLRDAMNQVEALADKFLPPDIGMRFINEAARLDETSNDVALTFVIAIVVVLLVLAAQFESVLSAMVIILTVPFGLAAAVFSLKLTGTTINLYSQVGLVMLVGLMAKNGILVVEFADQLRDRGQDVQSAIRDAAMIRLRPVIMTMLSTVLGALPLVFASGAGQEARQAIGWVVFGGLGISTAFTLLLIPVLYSLLAPLAKPRAHAGVRLDRELRDAAQIEQRGPTAAGAPAE